MNEIKRLERRISLLCCFHLALLTLCLAFLIGLVFPGDRPLVSVLWALGTVVPVQLIHQICLRVPEKLSRLLCSGLVALIAVLLPDDGMRRLSCALCCLPILVAGLWLKRPYGKIVLTVPKIYHLLACLFLYSFGKIVRSPLMCAFGIALAALMTLSFCFYRNQEKMLRTLRDAGREEVDHRSIIALNRRVMLVFAALGILVLAAVPWLLRWQGDRVAPVETEWTAEHPVAVTETTLPEPETMPPDVIPTEPGKLLNYDTIGDAAMWIFVGIIGCVILLVIAAILIDLFSIQGGNGRHSDPDRQQEWQLERLETKTIREGKEEAPVGWDKKLRRRYEKLIRSRTKKDDRLNALTPAELGQAADLRGEAAETILTLYEQTRYGPNPADRERCNAFKEAVKALDPPSLRDTDAGNGTSPENRDL